MNLNEILKKKGVRCTDLALILEITQASASRIISGKQKLTIRNAALLAAKLRLDTSVIDGKLDFKEIPNGLE